MGAKYLETEFISIEQLAEKKGLTVAWLRKAKSKYGLPFYKFGRNLKFKESEFDLWAAQRRQT